MHIGIIGAGNIGGNIARQLARAGHQITISFTRDLTTLEALADEIGATAARPADAAQADVIVLSVPWGAIDQALAQAGPLGGRIVIDTTNQFAAGRLAGLEGHTAARHNANRMPGARYTKCFNTLTAGFQAAAATATARSGWCSGSAATRPRRSRWWAGWWPTPATSLWTWAESTTAR